VGSRSRARARAKASEAARPASQAPVPAARVTVPAAQAAEPAPEVAEPASGPRPSTITVASAVEAVEAALVLVAAILAGIDTGAGRSYQLSSGIAITVIGIAMAGLLGLVAAGLRRPRRWTRTPALLTQLFTGIVGIYLVQGGKLSWGVPAIVLAVVGFATLLAPSSTRALTVGLPQPADRHRKR
jgi:MYXO-CTERM domain-containing protein